MNLRQDKIEDKDNCIKCKEVLQTNLLDIEDIIEILKTSTRSGQLKDDPEGTRYITISDTLTEVIIKSLKEYIKPNIISGSWINPINSTSRPIEIYTTSSNSRIVSENV